MPSGAICVHWKTELPALALVPFAALAWLGQNGATQLNLIIRPIGSVMMY
jgi:hypothetical protein